MATKNVWNKKAIAKVSEISVKALNTTGQVLLNQAIINVTPLSNGRIVNGVKVEGGMLRKSLVVDNATMSNPRMRIVSKGNIAPYNVAVHEIRFINYTTPGTNYKFLENPFRDNASKTFNRVLKGEMKKNGY